VVLPDPGGNLPAGGVLPWPDGSGTDYAAFVATSDFTLTGGFGVFNLDDRSAYFPDPAWATQVVSPDPVAKANGDHVFIINRFTYDNISVLDRKMHLVKQYSVADSSCDPSNPHDLAFVSETRAYLSRYECRDLWIINPITGQRLGAINLTAAGYGGTDGIPEMSGLLLHGSTLFVAVQTIDRRTWQPEGPGRLVMIDTLTDTVIGDAVLGGANPVTDVAYSPELDLVLVGDGGVEMVDPDSGAWLGYMIGETALGGNLGDFEIVGGTRGYATVSARDFASILVAFDPATGVRDPKIIHAAGSGFTLWDLAANDRGELYVSDRSATEPGLIVIDTLSGDRILPPAPASTGLPPFSIVFLR
jgi:hypothetical protein